MKRLLLAPLLLGLIPSANAANTCKFVSEYYPDVTIEIKNQKEITSGFGKIKFKNKPMLDFSTGLSNGYGGQYFVIRNLEKDAEGNTESVAYGKVVSMVGDQITRGTPTDKQKTGRVKMMFPNLGTGYYYSLSNFNEPEKDGRFAGRTKAMTALLRASEGFFIPDKVCERFVYFKWN
ncbi:hypothetical protein HA149_06205 [Prochlorococcus marinus XMU1406]|uniref:hypothetical protein n=1 Tax=Prochlorococcus marinus TaxID=1219 RepID=UPI001ADD0AF0|nr:hypothetical protein [Prochlorococcus marinus]MBO8206654.1 hypothetical protein [Prochlorococcus marinus XMU1406]MCR8544292.1 hypothetical protein [Prochlorococcus marinus XMU1427]